MKTRHRLIAALGVLSLTVACTTTTFNPLEEYEALEPATILEPPAPRTASEAAERGRYLVGILGCSTCHTDGALAGQPNPERRLAGSRTGIAYTSPLVDQRPGVVYPSNLTPDNETGIGNWSRTQLVQMIQTGVNRHGTRKLSVMPWPAYSRLADEDAQAIATYLLSLAPVSHQVPEPVWPGQRAKAPYVHFGTYRSK